jgi:hypothetical protein
MCGVCAYELCYAMSYAPSARAGWGALCHAGITVVDEGLNPLGVIARHRIEREFPFERVPVVQQPCARPSAPSPTQMWPVPTQMWPVLTQCGDGRGCRSQPAYR